MLGEFLPDAWRRLLDLPAFWLVYLPVEFPAIYPVGVVALIMLLGSRRLDAERWQATLVLATLAAASLVGLVAVGQPDRLQRSRMARCHSRHDGADDRVGRGPDALDCRTRR